MEVPTKNRVVESIDSPGAIDKFAGVSKAKTFRTWISGRKNIATKRNNIEMSKLLETIEKAYNYYHPRSEAQVEVDSWKGKSSLEIIKSLDGLRIIKYQKPSKGSEPMEIITDITKMEISATISALNGLSYLPKIETRDIANRFCRIIWNIDRDYFKKSVWTAKEFDWDKFFAYRALHNRLTLILGAFDKLGAITYSGGKTTVLDKPISIQKILK